jgi:hypothetical protein
VTVPNDHNTKPPPPPQDQLPETKSLKDDDDDIDELNESLQDLIIEYRLQEQQKNSEINQENDEDEDDDVNLQRILKQIGVSLHDKYRQKKTSEQSSTKLSNMIQQLYQTLKKTQPHLFTKSLQKDKNPTDNLNDQPLLTDTNTKEEIEEDESDQEEIIPLTPEMEHANTLFDQATKLINVTINRQYET